MIAVNKNPYTQIRMYFKPEEFYGSNATILQLVEGISDLPQPKSFELFGLPGTGKTAILRYLAHPQGAFVQAQYRQYLEGPYDFFPVHVEFRLLPSNMHSFVYMYERFFKEWRTWQNIHKDLDKAKLELPEPEEKSTEIEAVNILEVACCRLDRSAIRPVLLLDDFDLPFKEMSEKQTNRLRPLRGFAAFVIATEQSFHTMNFEAAGSLFFYNIGLIECNGLNLEDAERLVREPAEKAGYPFQKPDVEFILEQSGKYPSLLFRGCETLWELRRKYSIEPDVALSDEQRDALLGQLKGKFQPLLRLYWNRLSGEEQKALLKVAQNPQILSRLDREILGALEKRTGLVEAHRESIFTFFSPMFRELVQNSTNSDPALTGLELALYNYLRERADQICTFEELHRQIWNQPLNNSEMDKEQDKRRVQVAVSRLRSKLRERTREEILSIRDQGYRLIYQT